MKSSRHILLLLGFIVLYTASAFAQPGFKVDIDKPKPYEERKLKSEKTGDGKLKTTKRIFQNLTTHFNYYFNANAKLDEVLAQAKEQHKDDYAELLSFYNYDLAQTAADSLQLDSVVYKARTGLANHDLRNEWTDELYLLWARSWHLEQKFDSASMMLQFINYAYAPQYEEGFYKAIGTREDGAKELSIATKEDKKFLHNNNFSRNTAFIWQIRTLVDLGKMDRASSLITTLRRDPVFPERLSTDLDEVEAYWNYRQEKWDSAAAHLLAALDGDYPKLEKARWRYLAAQMLEKAGKTDEATKLFEQVVASTPDPVMEVYARLNLVRLSKDGGENAIDQNLAELLKMAKRDKYEEYRDIIYYMAAQMEMERNNIAAASELLIKASKYNNGNEALRNKAFLQIADASYAQKKYIQAAAFYDSVQVAGLSEADTRRVNNRKPPLQKVVFNTGAVERQDSLQRIAALPPEERTAFVKALSKKLRKANGLKEDASSSGAGGLAPLGADQPTDLFGSQAKGEWYFYNSTAKAQGAAQFKAIWGNRPNVDNWRRFAAINQRQSLDQPDQPADVAAPTLATAGNPAAAPDNYSVEGLLSKLPLTPEALTASNDSIKTALLNLGRTYLNEMEDYPSAIETFEELRRRFPNADNMDEVLFSLYYAYSKTGNFGAAAQARKLLSQNFAGSRFATIAATGTDPQSKDARSAQATKAYEDVYNLFIEGRFAEAETAKRIADSTYKTNFWQPQLLYIESVYYIRQRQDSVATTVLQTIIRQNTNPVLTEKAKTMIDVLSRRKQIEDELTRLQITRPVEDTTTVQPYAYQPPAQPKQDTVATASEPATDTVTLQPAIKKPNAPVVVDKAAVEKPKDAVATIGKPNANIIDTALVGRQGEKARNEIAAQERAAEKARQDSLDRVKLAQQRVADSLARAAKTADPVAVKKPVLTQPKDTVVKKKIEPVVVEKPPVKKLATSPEGYVYDPDAEHYAVVVLNKVDPIFVNEAKNAFSRYNQESASNKELDVQIVNLTADTRLLLISGLPTARAATDYVTKAKALAASEIIPWLTGNKYSFSIISAPNLELLKTRTDLNVYQAFLEKQLPGKF